MRNRGIRAALLGALVDAATERAHVRLVVSPTARSVSLYRRAGFLDADGEAGALLFRAREPLSARPRRACC